MKVRVLLTIFLLAFFSSLPAQNCVRAAWVKKFGTSGTDLLQEICADSGRMTFTAAGQFGTSITLGSTTLTNATGRGYFICRFDTAGVPFMAALVGHCSASVGNVIEIRQLETDNAGNIYISGYYAGAVTIQGSPYTGSSFGTFYVAKFSSTGAPLWVRTVNNGSRSFAHGLAVDDVTGDVFIAGGFEGQMLVLDNITLTNRSTSSPYNGDAFIAQLNSATGLFVWAQNFGTTNGDVAYSLALDGQGGIFVSGNFGQGSASLSPTVLTTAPRTTWNFYVGKFSTSGVAQWVNIIHAGGTGEQMVSWQATCDDAGSLYIAGECNGTYLFGNAVTITTTGTTTDAFMAKFRNDGQCAWVRTGGTTGSFEVGNDLDYYQGQIAFCGTINGNYPVFGNQSQPATGTKTFSSICDTTGNFTWVRTYCTSSSASAAGTVFDASGVLYTGGQFTQSETWYPVTLAPLGPYDAYLVKFKMSSSASPAVNAGPDHTISCGTTVALSGSSVTPAGTVYQWSGPNGFTSGTLSPGVSPGNTSMYILTGIYQGCSDADTTLVIVSPNTTTVSAGADVAVCAGDGIQLNATSNPAGATFTWSPAAGLSSATVSNPMATPLQTTDYIVTATNGSCTSRDTVRVTVNPKPFFNLASSYSTCQGDPVNITAGSPSNTYTWSPSTGLSSTTSYSVTATPSTSQIYSVNAVTAAGCADSRTFTFTVTNSNPVPTVTVQPVNVNICAGNSVSFSAAATNSSTVFYRWEMDAGSGWVPVPVGAPYGNVTNATMLINPVTAAMNGHQFRCRIYSTCSPVTYSNVAVLTITGAPNITVQPPNRNICPGNSTTFPVSLTGSGYTYQWQGDFGSGFVNLTNTAPHSGVTLATLTVTNATSGMNGYQYRCLITGCSPSATTVSDTAVLSVGQPPAILTEPQNDTTCAGSSSSFTLTQSGGSTYLWQYYNGSTWVNLTNTSPYSGVTTATLSINPVSPAQAGVLYRCRVLSGCSALSISDSASITLVSAGAITSSPSNVNTCPNDSVSFSMSALNAFSYQWEVNMGSGFVSISNVAPYSGVSTPVLSVNPVNAAMDNYQYRCTITDSCGNNLLTGAALLTISPSMTVTQQPQHDTVCSSSAAQFTVSAVNAIAYQWEMNSGAGWTVLSNVSPFSGVNTASLTVNPVSAFMDGNEFRCILTDVCGRTDSSQPAILGIELSAVINSAPVNDTTCVGSTAAFTVSATHAVAYQWEENAGSGWTTLSNTAPYSGATSAALNISPVGAGMIGNLYRCVVTNICGVTSTSDSASIVISNGITITSDPADITRCENEPASFVCTASGAVAYQWEADFGSGFAPLSNSGIYSGVTTAQLNISAVSPSMNTAMFRCLVSGCAGSVTTTAAVLTVNAAPIATLAPQPIVCLNWSPVVLTGGSPAGGTYSGPGVAAGLFDPGVAGAGPHTITYTVIDSAGCSDTAQQQITVDLCTGLDTGVALSGISVYPNPVQTTAWLVFDNVQITGEYTVEVFSPQGQLIGSEQHIITAPTRIELDFSDHAKGIYLVRVNVEDHFQTIRFVVL